MGNDPIHRLLHSLPGRRRRYLTRYRSLKTEFLFERLLVLLELALALGLGLLFFRLMGFLQFGGLVAEPGKVVIVCRDLLFALLQVGVSQAVRLVLNLLGPLLPEVINRERVIRKRELERFPGVVRQQ